MSAWSLVLSFTFFLFILMSFENNTASETEGYGLYQIVMTEYKQVGPRSPLVSIVPKIDSSHGHRSIIDTNITFHSSVVIDEAKFESFRILNGTRHSVMRKSLKKPCTSMYYHVIKQLLPMENDFKEVKGSCVMNKKVYVFKLDTASFLEAVIGRQFYYGDYFLRFTIYSKRKILYQLLLGGEIKKI